MKRGASNWRSESRLQGTLAVMAAGNGNRVSPRIQLGADQQGAAPFATRNGLDGVGWLLSEKLVTIHDAVFNGAGVRFVDNRQSA